MGTASNFYQGASLSRSFCRILEKPTHTVYLVLTIFGLLSAAHTIQSSIAVVSAADKDFDAVVGTTMRLTMAFFLTPAAIHFIGIYTSLLDCEDDQQLKEMFKGWVGCRFEVVLRYLAIFFLVVVSGKFAIEGAFSAVCWNVSVPSVIAIFSCLLFLTFLIWSAGAYNAVVGPITDSNTESDKAKAECVRKVLFAYAICDAVALIHWFAISILIVTEEARVGLVVIFFAAVYFLSVSMQRFGGNYGRIKAALCMATVAIVLYFILRYPAIQESLLQ
jgi:hypothetical protein